MEGGGGAGGWVAAQCFFPIRFIFFVGINKSGWPLTYSSAGGAMVRCGSGSGAMRCDSGRVAVQHGSAGDFRRLHYRDLDLSARRSFLVSVSPFDFSIEKTKLY